MSNPPAKVRGKTGLIRNIYAVMPPVVVMGWVAEPEIPRPEGNFLQWTTNRAFMEDDLQIRIQMQGMHVSPSAKVTLEVLDYDPVTSPDDILVITNDDEVYKKKKDKVKSEKRPLKKSVGIGRADWAETSKNILLEHEVRADTGEMTSYLVTTINLPVDPSGVETDDLEYFFIVTIKDQKQKISLKSTRLTALRWWASPKENLKIQKTNASEISPLIDGEKFFDEFCKAIEGASKYVYLASWTMWPFMFLTGEPAGGGKRLSKVLKDAAGRGVNVYILMDHFNGSWVIPLLNAHVKHSRIHVKQSNHPNKIMNRQHGSYHEKYLCVDGKIALVGGIDLRPDRYQPQSHSWKSDNLKFKTEAATYGVSDFNNPFMLWHDAGVMIKGEAVKDIERNFAVRWNDAMPKSAVISVSPPSKSTGSNHNIQVVKTDLTERWIRQRHTISYKGTMDAYRRAIMGARHYIYIENQYFSYPKLGDMLYKALQADSGLQLIVVIPFATEEAIAVGGAVFDNQYWIMGGWDENGIQRRIWMHGTYLQAQLIKKLRKVSNAANRVGIYGLAGCYTGATTPEMIYPHSKTMVVDDTWAYIGSANTNGRGFVTDGEMGVIIHNRAAVTAYRRSLWKEHLGIDLKTRKIRDFFKTWNSKALSGKKEPGDCTCSEVATVHAVKIKNPPKGQEYNGPFSSVVDVDDYC